MQLLVVSLKQRGTCQSLPKEVEVWWAHGISGNIAQNTHLTSLQQSLGKIKIVRCDTSPLSNEI